MSIRLYEVVFMARQDVTSGQVETMTQSFINLIRENGGEVTKTEFIGLRTLAYPIKKNKKGHYVLMNVKAEAKTVHEMERLMRLNEDIIRNLTIIVEAHDNTPSPLMQQKNYKDNRSRYNDEDTDVAPKGASAS